jgi:hypothetical protein
MHAASSLESPQEAQDLREDPPVMQCREPQGRLFPLEPALEDELPDGTIEAVIARRGSSRRFHRSPITYQQLSVMLDRAAQAIPADFLDGRGATLNQLYLIVHDVEGLPSGSYVFPLSRRRWSN